METIVPPASHICSHLSCSRGAPLQPAPAAQAPGRPGSNPGDAAESAHWLTIAALLSAAFVGADKRRLSNNQVCSVNTNADAAAFFCLWQPVGVASDGFAGTVVLRKCERLLPESVWPREFRSAAVRILAADFP